MVFELFQKGKNGKYDGGNDGGSRHQILRAETLEEMDEKIREQIGAPSWLLEELDDGN